jgi:hypothetical protein
MECPTSHALWAAAEPEDLQAAGMSARASFLDLVTQFATAHALCSVTSIVEADAFAGSLRLFCSHRAASCFGGRLLNHV